MVAIILLILNALAASDGDNTLPTAVIVKKATDAIRADNPTRSLASATDHAYAILDRMEARGLIYNHRAYAGALETARVGTTARGIRFLFNM